MKPGRNILTGMYADILRQIPAKLLQNFFTGLGAVTVKIRNLMLCVDTGIGSAAAADLNGLLQNPCKRCLQLALNGIILVL